jgi:hypothetical protein
MNCRRIRLSPVATGQHSELIDLAYKNVQGLVRPPISTISLFIDPYSANVMSPLRVSNGCAHLIGAIPPPLEIDRDCLLTVLHDIESLANAPIDESLSPRIAKFLFIAFDRDPFELRARIADVMHLLCKPSPGFVASLLDVGPIAAFLSVLGIGDEAKLVLNLISVLSLFYSIPGGRGM